MSSSFSFLSFFCQQRQTAENLLNNKNCNFRVHIYQRLSNLLTIYLAVTSLDEKMVQFLFFKLWQLPR